VSFKVYFDFTCPYDYRFRRWLDLADLGYDVEWRCFLHAQAHETRPGVRLFDRPETNPPGLAALCAFYFLRQKDQEHADAFHRKVMAARHEAGVDIDDRNTLLRLGADVGVDRALIEAAITDRSVLRDVGAEHDDAVMAHAVFGTPTIVSHEGDTLYVRLGAPPEDEPTARRVIRMVVDIALTEPSIRELKRT
jgi:predicted DsbA family dithiol-disulfide isomerase